MPSRSYLRTVIVAMRWTYAAVLLAFSILWGTFLVTFLPALSTAFVTSTAIFIAVCAYFAWRAMVGTLRPHHLVLFAVPVAALHMSWALGSQGLDSHLTPSIGLRSTTTVAVIIGAASFAGPRLGTMAAVVAVGAHIGAEWIDSDPLTALYRMWTVLGAGIAANAIYRVMIQAGRRTDAARREKRRSDLARAGEDAQRHAEREFRRLLHDSAAASLRVISLDEVTPAERREAAAQALAAFASARQEVPAEGPADPSVALADIVAHIRTPTSLEIDGPIVMPADVSVAILGAATEALRNVDRHAAASRVTIRLAPQGRGVRLTVTDDGIGIDPRARRPSTGLTDAVIGRMKDVGGQAEITGRPGRGTTVVLTWQPEITVESRHATRADLIRAAIGDVRRPLAAVIVPYATLMCFVAIRETAAGRSAPGWLLWFAALVCMTMFLLARADTGISRAHAYAVMGYGLAGVTAFVMTMPTDAFANESSWLIGTISLPLTILAVVRPARESLTAVALVFVAVIAVVLGGRFGYDSFGDAAAEVTPAVLSMAYGPFMGFMLSRTVTRLGSATVQLESERLRSERARAIADARDSLHRQRLTDLEHDVLPFLRTVAEGTAAEAAQHEPQHDPQHDADVRRWAEILEYAVRDEIHLPGTLDRPTRDLLRQARERGCQVVVQSQRRDAPAPPITTELLATALRAGATPHELTLTVQGDGDDVRVSCVAIPGDRERARALSAAFTGRLVELDDSPEATWVEIGG